MSNEYRQSKEELQQHLRDTVQALELSALAFEKGLDGEAKRLAAAIRVLVHDTGSSMSLLGQLGEKTIRFYDTSVPRDPRTILTYSGLTAMNLATGEAREAKHVAFLDRLPPDCPPRWVSFDDWWRGVIFVDRKGDSTSRKDLILAVANKDGGGPCRPCSGRKVRRPFASQLACMAVLQRKG